MHSNLLTVSDAAAFLSLAPATLDNWRSLGKGPPYVRLGRAVRYRRTDLEAFIAEGAAQPGASSPPSQVATEATA